MDLGFPWWLRVEHFLNIVFISFLVRSGIEILGTYPRSGRRRRPRAGHSCIACGSATLDLSPSRARSTKRQRWRTPGPTPNLSLGR